MLRSRIFFFLKLDNGKSTNNLPSTILSPSYHVKEEVGRDLFESCRHDSSGITNLICITKFGRDCASYLDFIHAIGDNGVTTFDIAFKFLVEEPFVLDSPELLSCEQNYKGWLTSVTFIASISRVMKCFPLLSVLENEEVRS